MEFEKEERLLADTKRLLDHNKEIERLKGESFNVFSILKMETKENATHSMFLAELLNPKGSHLKNDMFLRLFLEVIENKNFDSERAEVVVEKHISKVDYQNAQGGRIDIYIADRKGRTICIENKIYATDQHRQIQRYYNHNKTKNQVYYLTLNGEEPSSGSCGDLISGTDFICLSYRHTIVAWLEKCIQHAAEEPILRESIRQYLILIKKLTGTLGDKRMEKELMDLLLNNLDAAYTIGKNINAVIYKVKEDFRREVQVMLQERVGTEFKVTPGNNVDKNYAQLWIFPSLKTDLKYGIEAFSGKGHFDGSMFFGIQSPTVKKDQLPKLLQSEKNFGTWIQYRLFENYDGKVINLRHKYILSQLSKNTKFREGLKNQIVNEFMDYFDNTKEEFIKFIQTQQ